MASAIVLSASGGVYDVELEDGTIAEASLRGRLKLEQRTGDRVVAGDSVEVDVLPDGSITIESVAPRTSQLARRAPGRTRKAKVIVANIDRVIIVFALRDPEPKQRLLDRFLVLAEANRLDVLIVLNKIDLADAAAASAFLATYEAAGYATLRASAAAGTGLDAFRDAVCGSRSVVTGPSGAGKSTLLNTVQPGLALRTAAVSEAVHKGQHTTVSARLIPLECGGYVADTPGLRELGLWGIEPSELPDCFPEFADYIDACRFGRSCTHVHEPGCAVRDAAAAGAINAGRLDSYVTLRGEVEEAPRY